MDLDIHIATPTNINEVISIDWRLKKSDGSVTEILDDISGEFKLPLQTIDTPDNKVYVSARINYQNVTPTEDHWSLYFLVTQGQIGFKFSNTIIVQPTITLDVNYHDIPLDDFTIFLSDFKLISGIGNHIKTSYKIVEYNSSQNYLPPVWQRLETEDALQKIKVIETNLKPNRLYQIWVKYHTDTNAETRWSKQVVRTTGGFTI